jgi:hypothetical protein
MLAQKESEHSELSSKLEVHENLKAVHDGL